MVTRERVVKEYSLEATIDGYIKINYLVTINIWVRRIFLTCIYMKIDKKL